MLLLSTATPSNNDILTTLENALNNGDIWWALGIFVFGYAAYKIILAIAKKAIKRSKINKNVHTFIISVLRVVLLCVLYLAVLTKLGVPMESMLVVLSTLGLAISLSLQGYVGNLVGGLIILVTDQFDVGDMVDVGETSGVVSSVSLYYTKIRTYDGKIVSIPNGLVSNNVVKNSSSGTHRRAEIVLKIPAELDFEQTKAEILKVVMSNKHVVADPAPAVVVTGIGYHSTIVTVFAWSGSLDTYTMNLELLESLAIKFNDTAVRTL